MENMETVDQIYVLLQKHMEWVKYSYYSDKYAAICKELPEWVNVPDYSIKDSPEIVRVLRRYIDLCFEEYDSFDKGYISKELWESMMPGIKASFTRLCFREAWKLCKQDTWYPKQFVSLIDSFIQ